MLASVTESFVDLTYRGLSLGRRIKLTQVRPSTGYLEHPTPMPVGTKLSVVTDEGETFDAVVTHIHEQVGGSEKAPGMTVKPSVITTWWTTRVTLPEAEPPRAPERAKSVTVRPRSHTMPAPPPEGALLVDAESSRAPTIVDTQPMTVSPGQPMAAMPAADGDKKTAIMNAVDQELLSQLTREAGDLEAIVRSTGEHEIVDDGQRTVAMAAVDPAALGLEVSASGQFPVVSGDEEGDEEPEGNVNGTANGGDKKKLKKRKKRR